MYISKYILCMWEYMYIPKYISITSSVCTVLLDVDFQGRPFGIG